MSVFPCAGACGLYVDRPGQWCASCWPQESFIAAIRETGRDFGKQIEPRDPIQSSPDPTLRLRHRILDSAFRLAFGTRNERAKALSDIAHLTVVLQQETKENT